MTLRFQYGWHRRNESSSSHKSSNHKRSCNPSKPRLFAFVNRGLLRRAFGRQVRLGRIAFLCVKIEPALYSQIIRDKNLSDGAFRLCLVCKYGTIDLRPKDKNDPDGEKQWICADCGARFEPSEIK